MVENNPHKISTMGTADGSSLAAITDASDFPHTGLIKGLSLMARQNIVIKGSNDSATHDFNITQATSGNVIQVAQGSYLRDGKLFTAIPANFTIGTTSNDTSLLAHSQFDKGYHLLVVNSSNAIKMRQPTVANKVPDYTSGDTIIAVIEISSTTSDGSRLIQYLTSDKTSNSVSIAYTASNTYTEALSIESSASGDVTVEGKVQDKDIIFKANDGGASTEIMRLDSSTLNVGIGTNAPDKNLHIRAATSPTLRIQENSQDGYLDLVGLQDSQAQILAKNTSTNEATMLDIDVDADGSGSQSVRFFRNSGTTGSSFIYFLKGDSTNTTMALLKTTTGQMSFGTNTIDANAMITVEGAISLDEISAPTNTADRGQIYTNADNELHMIDGAGTDTVLLKGGKHTIWIPASAMTPTTTAGCANLVLVEMTASRPELQVLDFAADADDHAQFTVAFPKSWNEGAVNFQPFWTVTGTNTGDVEWNLTGTSIANNGVINTAYPTASVSAGVAHSGTSNDLNVGAVCGGLTIGNAAVDTVTYFKLSNDTGSSTQTGVARLIGIKLFYDIVAGNDE